MSPFPVLHRIQRYIQSTMRSLLLSLACFSFAKLILAQGCNPTSDLLNSQVFPITISKRLMAKDPTYLTSTNLLNLTSFVYIETYSVVGYATQPRPVTLFYMVYVSSSSYTPLSFVTHT